MNEENFNTQYFKIIGEPEEYVRNVLIDVYSSLVKKGYGRIYYVRRSYLYHQL